MQLTSAPFHSSKGFQSEWHYANQRRLSSVLLAWQRRASLARRFRTARLTNLAFAVWRVYARSSADAMRQFQQQRRQRQLRAIFPAWRRAARVVRTLQLAESSEDVALAAAATRLAGHVTDMLSTAPLPLQSTLAVASTADAADAPTTSASADNQHAFSREVLSAVLQAGIAIVAPGADLAGAAHIIAADHGVLHGVADLGIKAVAENLHLLRSPGGPPAPAGAISVLRQLLRGDEKLSRALASAVQAAKSQRSASFSFPRTSTAVHASPAHIGGGWEPPRIGQQSPSSSSAAPSGAHSLSGGVAAPSAAASPSLQHTATSSPAAGAPPGSAESAPRGPSSKQAYDMPGTSLLQALQPQELAAAGAVEQAHAANSQQSAQLSMGNPATPSQSASAIGGGGAFANRFGASSPTSGQQFVQDSGALLAQTGQQQQQQSLQQPGPQTTHQHPPPISTHGGPSQQLQPSSQPSGAQLQPSSQLGGAQLPSSQPSGALLPSSQLGGAQPPSAQQLSWPLSTATGEAAAPGLPAATQHHPNSAAAYPQPQNTQPQAMADDTTTTTTSLPGTTGPGHMVLGSQPMAQSQLNQLPSSAPSATGPFNLNQLPSPSPSADGPSNYSQLPSAAPSATGLSNSNQPPSAAPSATGLSNLLGSSAPSHRPADRTPAPSAGVPTSEWLPDAAARSGGHRPGTSHRSHDTPGRVPASLLSQGSSHKVHTSGRSQAQTATGDRSTQRPRAFLSGRADAATGTASSGTVSVCPHGCRCILHNSSGAGADSPSCTAQSTVLWRPRVTYQDVGLTPDTIDTLNKLRREWNTDHL